MYDHLTATTYLGTRLAKRTNNFVARLIDGAEIDVSTARERRHSRRKNEERKKKEFLFFYFTSYILIQEQVGSIKSYNLGGHQAALRIDLI